MARHVHRPDDEVVAAPAKQAGAPLPEQPLSGGASHGSATAQRLLGLQRLAGNRAVASTLLGRTPAPIRPGEGVDDEEKSQDGGGCPCDGACSCAAKRTVDVTSDGEHYTKRDREPTRSKEVMHSKDGPAEKDVDYSKTHRCSLGEGVRIFASWAYATSKLMENLPALELQYATGLYTDNLKTSLKKHFNVGPKDKAQRERVVKRLIKGYNTVLGVMGAGLMGVRCGGEHCEAGDYAYVFPSDKDNIIYLCDTQFAKGKSNADLACTWIHELSHKSLGLDDKQYYSSGGSTSLATDDALDNADCWGNFMATY